MRRYYRFSLFLLLLQLPLWLTAQLLPYKQGELIVQLKPQGDVKELNRRLAEVDYFKVAVRTMNSHVLYFDPQEYTTESMFHLLRDQPEVALVQFNHFVTLRSSEIPNDPLFNNQWQYRNTGQAGGNEGADFNILPAWDITTGGVTPNGDTIVICVIDNGIDDDHEDLAPNLWINQDEIPENGLDDDNNGYVDDYRGWNTANDNNNISGGPHGTSVAGIIGARGNNAVGVAGTNWTTKLMIVRNDFFASEAEILQAYGYALDARRDYDESNGERGAYVVATNASWGIDFGRAEDSPIWCNLYDEMGAAGILNVGATTNGNINVDEEGDLPTNCPSDFLIGVTNVNGLDEKEELAGYGTTHIDLGAYGERVFTTRNNGSYGPFPGTSAATPAVTGTIGLMYSVDNDAFAALLAADPPTAALLVRNTILDNVKRLDSLVGLVATDGVLDIGASVAALNALSSNCLAPLSARVENVGLEGLEVTWNQLNIVDSVTLRYRVAGTDNWTNAGAVTSPYRLAATTNCTVYEVQLLSNCAEEIVMTPIFSIETEGCCRPPEEVSVGAISSSSVLLAWNDILAAQAYEIRYRPTGTTDWTTTTAVGRTLLLTDLMACTNYEVEIRSDCDTTASAFAPALVLLTAGCGACLDLDYCTPTPPNNAEEWIGLFNLGNRIVNETEAAEGGYESYGELPGSTVARGGVYPLVLQPEHSGTVYAENFKVWVDWDQNGFFSGGELAGEGSSEEGVAVTIPITVPPTASLGLPRMRVVMEFLNVQSPCNVNSRNGETEDYCLRVIDSPGCVAPERLTAEYRDDTETVELSWPASLAPGGEYLVRYRPRNTTEWTEVRTEALQLTLTEFSACDNFEAQVASSCQGEAGGFSTTIFNSCSSTSDQGISDGLWNASPNPAQGPVTVNWEATVGAARMELFSLTGRRLETHLIDPGATTLRLEMGDFPAGVYLLRLQTKDGDYGVRRLILR